MISLTSDNAFFLFGRAGGGGGGGKRKVKSFLIV